MQLHYYEKPSGFPKGLFSVPSPQNPKLSSKSVIFFLIKKQIGENGMKCFPSGMKRFVHGIKMLK